MSLKYTAAAIALMVGMATATLTGPALALGDLQNDGLIQQTVKIKGAAEMTQQRTINSLMAGNLVAAKGDIKNKGQIIQKFEAERLDLQQKDAYGSTACLNCVISGQGQ